VIRNPANGAQENAADVKSTLLEFWQVEVPNPTTVISTKNPI
jgi:hypothetical protein